MQVSRCSVKTEGMAASVRVFFEHPSYHTICEAVDKGKEIRAVICDISKAFDRVLHKGLFYNLRCMGCSNRIVNWFASYLSKHRQRVVIYGQSSDWVYILAGVPQGSILGLFYFSFTLMI